jgi:hypothetical protein
MAMLCTLDLMYKRKAGNKKAIIKMAFLLPARQQQLAALQGII